MIFPGCEANTDVTCLQPIAKKEVIAKNVSNSFVTNLYLETFFIIIYKVNDPCKGSPSFCYL